MTFVELDHVTVSYPILDGKKRSILGTIVTRSVGATIDRQHGKVSVTALNDLSIRIREGERVALIGPNGSGKSTLLQVVAGILPPKAGTVSVSGEVSPLFNAMLGVSSDSTGYENIRDRAVLFNVPRAHLTKQLEAAARASGLGEYLDLPVRSYSTGMRARLAFAMNLLLDPDIFLIDEWIGFVDHEFSKIAETRLVELANSSRIIMIASHNEQIIERICSRGVLMRSGRIEYDGDALEALRIYYRG